MINNEDYISNFFEHHKNIKLILKIKTVIKTLKLILRKIYYLGWKWLRSKTIIWVKVWDATVAKRPWH